MASRSPRIGVSQICSWGWSLEEDLSFYASTGVDRIGLHRRKLDARGWDDAVSDVVRSGLTVDDLIVPSPLRVARPADTERQRDELGRLAELAARCGAAQLCTTTGPPDGLDWDEAADALEALVRPVVGELAIPLTLEHTNGLRVDLSFLLTLRDAVDLARRIGVGVCVEITACFAERALGRTIRDGVDTFSLVQLSDFVTGTTCTPDRAVLGDGDIPWPRMLRLFEEAGYAGPYELELVGPRVEEEGYASAITRSIEALDDHLDRT